MAGFDLCSRTRRSRHAQGEQEEEQRLLEDGLQRFPAFDKLWLMLGQLEERRGQAAAARTAYQNGLKRCIHRSVRFDARSAELSALQACQSFAGTRAFLHGTRKLRCCGP